VRVGVLVNIIILHVGATLIIAIAVNLINKHAVVPYQVSRLRLDHLFDVLVQVLKSEDLVFYQVLDPSYLLAVLAEIQSHLLLWVSL
jgi:hypothetical protein